MFDGRDYHQAFQDALDELASNPRNRDRVLGTLVSLEFTLWEAIRGAMIVTSNLVAVLILLPIGYLAWQANGSGWKLGTALFAAWLLIGLGIYWLFRFAVYCEIARHVKGRRFGDLDLPWFPSGTGYKGSQYEAEDRQKA
jgi:hypothetical protein